MNINKIIYDNIHNLLIEKNISIGEFEKQIGVSRGYTSRMLKKRDNLVISLDICIKMADCLGVTVDDLVRSPLDKVLNDIKAEIESYVSEEPHQLMSKTTVLEIIDKYRKEQE